MINYRSMASLKDGYQAVLDSYDVMDAVTGQPVLALKPYLRLGIYHCGSVGQNNDADKIIAPVFIAHLLQRREVKQSELAIPADSNALNCTSCMRSASQSHRIYFSLLMAECQRLKWYGLADDLQSLTLLFYDEPWLLEQFAIAYFYGLLANDSEYFEMHASPKHGGLFQLPAQKHQRLLLLNTYRAKTPRLYNVVDEYVFFAFYNMWPHIPA